MKYLFSGFILLASLQIHAQNANRTLSNLTSPTAINTSLLPQTDNVSDIGSSSFSWKNIHLDGSLYMNGYKALSNGGNTNNIFLGKNAGNSTTGIGNVFAGPFAGYANTSGTDNIAIGYYAMFSNQVTYQNVAIGSFAQFYNQSGYYNTAVGYNALEYNTSGFYNTAIGSKALENTYSSGNTAVGERAGATTENGWGNTFLGQQCWANANGYAYSMALGYNSRITASNQVRIGSSTTSSIGGYRAWTNLSDGRFKKNIKENVPGLSFINKLKPVTYNLDIKGANNFINRNAGITEKNSAAVADNAEEEKAIRMQEAIVTSGFIAQDVEKVAKELNYNFDGVDAPKNANDVYGLRYAEFVVPLVKAVQELSKLNDEKEERIFALEQKLNRLESLLISTSVSNLSAEISLEQNTPNPFNSITTIRYNVPTSVNKAQIIVTNTAGIAVKTFTVNGKGAGVVNINANELNAGSYFYTLIVDGKKADSKQMVLVK